MKASSTTKDSSELVTMQPSRNNNSSMIKERTNQPYYSVDIVDRINQMYHSSKVSISVITL
jgi:hypothetical protein